MIIKLGNTFMFDCIFMESKRTKLDSKGHFGYIDFIVKIVILLRSMMDANVKAGYGSQTPVFVAGFF